MSRTTEWVNRVIDRKDKEIKDLRELFLTASDDADRWQDCAETAEAALYRVKELHEPREEQILTEDCAIEACDHEDGDCPTEPFTVCAECMRIADETYPYSSERGIQHVAYPCPTIQAIDERPQSPHRKPGEQE